RPLGFHRAVQRHPSGGVGDVLNLAGCVAQAPAADAGGEKLRVSIRAVERAVTSSSHCITNHATSQGRAMFFIILLVTESPLYVEIEDGYGREAVRAAVLRSCGVGRRCRVGWGASVRRTMSRAR